jgi:hypothetical protein
MGQERAFFRALDLIELADLVEHLTTEACKDNSAAVVKQMTPQRNA